MRDKLLKGVMVALLTFALLPLSAGVQSAHAKNKGKKILGIAIGVAAGAIILNEVSKANKKKKKKKALKKKKSYKKKAYKKKYKKKYKTKKVRKVHCHTGGKNHYHKAFGGKFWHAHEKEEGCASYRLDPKYDDAPGSDTYKPQNANSKKKPAGDPWARCETDFATFTDDGTYQPNGGGPRRLCPYL